MRNIHRVFTSWTRKLFIESPTANRLKMSGHKKNEPAQISSDTKEVGGPDETNSAYDYHYNEPFYVDKTLLIKKLFEIPHVLITTPSGFGKTLNLDMVRKFVEIELDKDGKPIVLDVDEDKCCLKEIQPRSKNFKLFQGKNISKEKEIIFKHFGKYPTIYVNFAGVQGSDFEQNLASVRTAIHWAFQEHCYLENSSFWDCRGSEKEKFMQYFDVMKYESLSEDELKSGLQILSKFLHSYYGRKVFVFIEDFDAPVNTIVYENEMTLEDRRKTIEFFQLMTGNLLNDNDEFVEKSLLNACHKFGSLLLGSANNVEHYAFMRAHNLSKFYGFEEDEVKHILETAGQIEDLNLVKIQYSGYKTTLRDGRDIEIYSPWAIVRYLKTEDLDVDWSASIPSKIIQGIGHFKISPIISDIMSGKPVTIKYVTKFEIKHIDMLSRMLCKNEVDEEGVDLFIQFIYEMGFFYPINSSNNSLTLAVPNAGVYSRINEILFNVNLKNKYSPDVIEQFTKSLDNMGQSCDDASVRALAKSINALFKSGEPPRNEFEFQSQLHGCMYPKFQLDSTDGDVCTKYISASGDLLLVMRRHRVGCIIKFKFPEDETMTSSEAYTQIEEKKYLLDEESLKILFRQNTPIVEKRIHLGILMNRDNGEVAITYTYNVLIKRKLLINF
ncbi:hypothetical protein PV328_000215 [Microctonus aethiopoides]|uniref:AAA-ATPase-like domain-containing protein n=1 Tax=Microctonus aethiopoides TaxID=144406 RepID=A0AA39KWA0_9HYME|nr:hypothetical protein PV328_000215 [Microctonus aethiopoides]